MIAGGESLTDHKLCDAQAIKKPRERHEFAKRNQVKLVVDKRQRATGSEQIKAVIGDDAAVLPQYTIGTSDQRLAAGSKKPDLIQRAGRKPVAASGQTIWVGWPGRLLRSTSRCQFRSVNSGRYFSVCGMFGCTKRSDTLPTSRGGVAARRQAPNAQSPANRSSIRPGTRQLRDASSASEAPKRMVRKERPYAHIW